MGRNAINIASQVISTGPRHDRINAGPGDTLIQSGAGRDLVFAGQGNDTIDGGAGQDTIFGGAGDDVAIFTLSENGHSGRYRDVYNGGTGEDTLRLNLTGAEWANESIRAEIEAYLNVLATGAQPLKFVFKHMPLTVSRFEKLEVFVDGVKWSEEVEVIDKSDSTEDENITVTGSAGDITTGSGNDTITGSAGDDTLRSGDGADLLYLGEGDDIAIAGNGNDTIIAGQGAGYDYIDSGAGQDTVEYTSVTSAMTIDLRPADHGAVTFVNGAATTVSEMLILQGQPGNLLTGLTTGAAGEVDTDILIGVEHVLSGKGNDTIYGDGADNRLDGAGGADSVSGGAGADALAGGAGNDTLVGGTEGDTLTGGAGDDMLDGGGGYDTIVLSGASTDYDVQTLGNGFYSITDNRVNGDGVDVFAQVEQLTFSDATLGLWRLVGNIDVFGDNNPNTLEGTGARERFYGLDGDDSINGGLEEDEFVGGKGNDTMNGGGPDFIWDSVKYDNEFNEAVDDGFAAQGVVVNLATGNATDVYGDTDLLIDIRRVYGTKLGDLITGSSGHEAFDPHGGNDTINGGDGWDSLLYSQSDGYYGGATSGIVVEFSASVEGSGTTLIDPVGDTDIFTGIEHLRGTRYADKIIGGAGTQEFNPLDGADTLDGGAGYDILWYQDDANYDGFGGIAFNLSVLNAAGYAVITDGFGKLDQVRNFEDIRGTGTADVMRGDATANKFWGNAGADLLAGAGGQDTLIGGLGDDTVEGGADTDDLFGDAGADLLTGGAGNDRLEGGADADRFAFAVGDGADQIADYELGSDSLSLAAGLTIANLTEIDTNGDGETDTLVTFSSGDSVALLFITGVGSAADLL